MDHPERTVEVKRSFGGSLRQRISIAVVGITSVVVAVAAVAIWMSSETLLMKSVDQELHEWAKRVHRDEGAHLPRRGVNNAGPQRGRGGPRGDGRMFLDITDATGRILFRSSSLNDDQPLPQGVGLDIPYTGTMADGRVLRCISLALTAFRQDLRKGPGEPPPRTGPPIGDAPAPPPATDAEPLVPVMVRIGFDISWIREELNRSAVMLASMWLAATVLAWAAVTALRATILRPLERLSVALDRLGPDDLAIRLPADAGPDEVRGIIQRLNDLLDRLHQAFIREQATIANIAHELRTPVAALRTDLEFRLLVATDPGERAMLTACMGTIGHMQTQVANLLLLARLESGKEPLQSGDCDLVDLITEVVERHRPAAARRGQQLVIEMPDTVPWHTSGDHLSLLMDNLLGNALAHGLPDQPIAITLINDQAGAHLRLANAFAGTVDPAELGKPYYRGDDARHDTAHCGLGLALCLRLSRLLGAALDFTTTGQQFICTLTLPPMV